MDVPWREIILPLTPRQPEPDTNGPPPRAVPTHRPIRRQPGRTIMDAAPLTLFAREVSASKRLLFADLRRLRRDVLPNGITSREETEVLLGLDHIERLDTEWPGYLTKAVAVFALSASEPPRLDPATTSSTSRMTVGLSASALVAMDHSDAS